MQIDLWLRFFRMGNQLWKIIEVYTNGDCTCQLLGTNDCCILPCEIVEKLIREYEEENSILHCK